MGFAPMNSQGASQPDGFMTANVVISPATTALREEVRSDALEEWHFDIAMRASLPNASSASSSTPDQRSRSLKQWQPERRLRASQESMGASSSRQVSRTSPHLSGDWSMSTSEAAEVPPFGWAPARRGRRRTEEGQRKQLDRWAQRRQIRGLDPVSNSGRR